MYDIIIIGGGVSGLYNYMKLIKHDSNLKIKLFERNDYFGGRICQYEENTLGTQYSFPEGAARFNTNHTKTIKLLESFKLLNTSNEKPNIASIEFIDSNNQFTSKFNNKDGFYYIDIVLKMAAKYSPNELQQYTFQDFASIFLNKYELSFLLTASGYSGQLKHMNMKDASVLFSKHIRPDLKYYGGKYHLLIQKLVEFIKKNKGLLQLNTNIKDVIYHNKKDCFKLIYNNTFCYSKKVIFSVPKNSLLKFSSLKPIQCILQNSVSCKPLCRVYAIFKKDDIWFQNINRKVVTNNPLRYIIPINKENGLIMISYTDDVYTNYWKNIQHKKKETKNAIVKLVKKTFNIDINPPHKVFTFYWDCGVAYWNKNIESSHTSNYLINPLPNLFITGENYSLTQSWVEGALDTSDKCIDKIIKQL